MEIPIIVSQKYRVVQIDCLPKPEELPNGTLYGNFSVTLPDQTKMIPYHYMREWGGFRDTETSFTRQFMKILPEKKARRSTFDAYLQSSFPLLVKPGYIDDAVYIDLTAAYPSIYKMCGWDLEYERGRFYLAQEPLIYPFPANWKAGRSFVVTGAMHLGMSRIVNNGKVFTKKYRNPYSNPQLVAFVRDVLSMIARFAEYATGAIYYNVDGGIMPRRGSEVFTGFLDALGLDYKIKARGQATVINAGCWSVGSKRTAHFSDKPGQIIEGDYITIGKKESEWLAWRLLR